MRAASGGSCLAKDEGLVSDDPRVLGNRGTTSFRVDMYPFYLLNRAVSRYTPLIEAALRPVGVDVPGWRVLMILGESAPWGMSQIADAAVINLSTMVRIVQSMTTAGLVSCAARTDDLRVTEVGLTTLGERKLADSRLAVAPVYERVSARDDGNATVQLQHHGFARRHENACSPVCARPKMRAWTSWVPS
jgi:MarR family transcriptional regulator, organic hydroperoxide resistance regulator